MLWRRLTAWPPSDWTTHPFNELDRVRRELDRLSEGFATGLVREPSAGVFPLMNVTEGKESFYVRAELPGIRSDDLEISVTGNTLSISGERKIPAEDEKARYHRKEREAGKFSRIIALPVQVDTSKVEAHCADGILVVALPKAEEAKPRQIAVKAS